MVEGATEGGVRVFFTEAPADPLFEAMIGRGWVTDRLERADAIVVPRLLHGPRSPADVRDAVGADVGCDRSRPTVLFVLTDFTGPLDVDGSNVVIFRPSLDRRAMRVADRLLPYLWEAHDEGAFPPKPCEGRPIATFCGLAGHPTRRASLRAVRRSRCVDTDYVLRKEYWGGKPHDPALVAAFWSNIEAGQFVVSTRGAGAYSMRLFQAMSAGRIPIVLLDEETDLPFADRIPWDEIAVVARSPWALRRALRRFVDEHGDLSDAQRRCRIIWEQFFSLDGFLDQFARELRGLHDGDGGVPVRQ